MAGIIQNTIDNGKPAYGADTTPYDASLRTVDPATETVAGQLNTILSSGSPYLERAKAGAMDTANSRGLLNSSMAAGAGEAAAIDSALPIAQADAGTYSTTAQQNQGYKNSAGQFNAASENAASTQMAGQAGQSTLATQTGEIETGLQELKGTQSETLANIEAQYKELMQTSASASSTFSQISKNITDILNDTNTSVAQKQNAIDAQTSLLKTSMNTIGSIGNVDLGGLIDFTGTSGGPSLAGAAAPRTQEEWTAENYPGGVGIGPLANLTPEQGYQDYLSKFKASA